MFWGRIEGTKAFRFDGDKIYIRAPRLSDGRQWRKVREGSREFLTPWEPSWSADSTTWNGYRKRFKRIRMDWLSGTACGFFIFARASDELVGGITLSNVRKGVVQSASLGYWIAADHARKGYMSEAVGLILDFSFNILLLHRVEAACLVHNEPSKGLLRKAGFTHEGRARKYLKIAGEWQDHETYAILSTDPRGKARGA